jgi:hypothetical protein
MGDDGVGQALVRQTGQHRHLHRGHDLAGRGADHREAEDMVAGADRDLLGY